ncbi:MAG: hypothetical protein ACLFQB_04515 [Chitinispirillaceae bacterium]
MRHFHIIQPILVLFLFFLPGEFHLASANEPPEVQFYRSRYMIPLQGEQDGSYPKNRFVVMEDVFIPEGSAMDLSEGTTIYLKAGTRIVIEGKLTAAGSETEPIRFIRLERDQYYKPIPRGKSNRWDGIFIHENGSAEISHARISGSKYGLEAVCGAENILIRNVTFSNNRYWNMKVDGNVIDKSAQAVLEFPDKPLSIPSAEETESAEPSGKISGKTIIRYSSLVLSVAGLGAGVYGLVQNIHHYDQYNKKRPGSDATIEEVDRHEKLLKEGKVIAIGGFSLGALGAAGFALTFTF